MGRGSSRLLVLGLCAVLVPACGNGGGGGGGAVQPLTWGTAMLLETEDLGNATSPKLVADGNGNVTVVWQQLDGARYAIWSRRYDIASGMWGTGVLIDTNNPEFAQLPELAVDPNGNVTAVWQQSDGSRYSIWANRYDEASGLWGASVLLESSDSDAWYPRVAVDPFGNATVAWQQDGDPGLGIRYDIWTNRYDQASGTWGIAQLIETDDAGLAQLAELGVDPDGNVTVVWYQNDGMRHNIVSNRYDQASGTWGTPTLLETTNLGGALYPEVAVDPNGNAIVVWQQSPGTPLDDVWTNRYDQASGTWGTAALLETDNSGWARWPEVVVDSNGNATAVWYQNDGVRDNITSSRYDQASGTWGTPVLIESDNAGGASFAQLGADLSGNLTAVWQQDGDPTSGIRHDIWANQYDEASGTWGIAQLIETEDLGSGIYPQVVVDSSGRATAVWAQTNGTYYNIWVNRYE